LPSDAKLSAASDLDRLLVTLDVSVQSFAICEIKHGKRLVGAAVDAIMIHYVLAGTMHMTLPGQEPVVCGAGCVTLIPPGLQPAMAADDGPADDVVGADNAYLRDGLLVMDAADGGTGDLRIAAGVVLASLSGSFGLLDRLRVPISENLSDNEMVRHAFATMLDEIARPTLGGRALTSSLMRACLLLVLQRYFRRSRAGPELIGALADPRLGAAVGMVLEAPAAPHTVASLAEQAGMSRSSFARAFTEAFELSPMEFVAKTRLHNAAEILRSTKLPIKVIAGMTGFSSRSHFSKAFRDAYGSDPTAFRAERALYPIDAPARLYGSRERFGLAEEPDC
jgi:AraC family transcriptional regulator, activator of mtrCDE